MNKLEIGACVKYVTSELIELAAVVSGLVPTSEPPEIVNLCVFWDVKDEPVRQVMLVPYSDKFAPNSWHW